MWKREESARPGTPVAGSGAPAPMSSALTPGAEGETPSNRPMGREVVDIGKSMIIKGELSGSEDLTIEGQIDGEIELRDHVLTIGPNGKIKAQVFAKTVIVMGRVTGNITATEKINIRENGSVEGEINAPTIAIFEGAQFRGSIDMQRQQPAHGAPARSRSAEPMRQKVAPSSDGLHGKSRPKSAPSPAQTPAAGAAH
jgi:cytoskeletal protein CcmA (bactofilin family)